MNDTDTQDETHEESADMREIVKAGQETDDKRNGHVEEDEDQIFDRATTCRPIVQEVQQREGEDTEERTGAADRCNAVGCVVAAENEAEDAGGKVDESEAQGADLLFHVATEGPLQ